MSTGWSDAERIAIDREVTLELAEATLDGRLTVPRNPAGLVLFAHGSGSSRSSPRNIEVSRRLHQAGVGTLLFDLLTEEESRTRARVFDIPFLARRLVDATGWLASVPEATGHALGYFGASTGAAAALVAAATLGDKIAAVVSRGGRPDLAIAHLPRVTAPTLLIVGGRDEQVLEWNRKALVELGGLKELVVIPGAGHLFEEPGTLDRVASLAADWFATHLAGQAARR